MLVFSGFVFWLFVVVFVFFLFFLLGLVFVGRISDGEVMLDAARRSSAARATTVIPYFGYSRQDRRPRSARVASSAKVVANMITSAGTDRVLTVDLHADQIQGFFDMPVDNVYASPILLGDIWRQRYPDQIVVSPDVG